MTMFPIGKDGNLISVHPLIYKSCDTLTYNLPKDWDSMILVTGDRKVRVGKSVLAMQIAAYCAYRQRCLGHNTHFTINDVYFQHKDLIDEAIKKPKYSINVYDEGREGLSTDKSFTYAQRDLIDFFNEAGQLNQIFIVVISDFFDLKEYIAIARSECMFNVWREDVKKMKGVYEGEEKIPIVEWERGHFDFFSDRQKQILYDKAKKFKQKNYRLVDVQHGQFPHQYIIDEEEYRKKKIECLQRYKKQRQENAMKRTETKLLLLKIKELKEAGLTNKCIADELFHIAGVHISDEWVRVLAKSIEEKQKSDTEE